MQKIGKKVVSVILSSIICVSSCIIFASAENKPTTVEVNSFEAATQELTNQKHVDELEADEVYPTIIIHGIGQATTYMLDEDGNDAVDPDGVKFPPLFFPFRAHLPYALYRRLIQGICNHRTEHR